MARILIVGNSISIDGAGNYGVQMVGCETSNISENTINRPLRQGILLSNCDIVRIDNNVIQDASYSSTGTYDAIEVQSSNRTIHYGNIAYGRVRNHTSISSGTGHSVKGARWRTISGNIDTTGATVETDDNKSF